MTSLTHLGVTAAGAALGMAGLWAWERRTRDASHVDAGWAAGIGLAAIAYAVLGDGDPWRRAVIASVAGAWSLRLAGHIISDRLLGKPEDGRYALLRERWGDRAGWWFFWFFQVQGLLVCVFSLPFWLGAADPRQWGAWSDWVGMAWIASALLWVAIADRQLARWRSDPGNKGRTCRSGLWRLSRHPNYFGEWLLWCGWVWVVAPAPHGWWSALIPCLLLFLLLKVTGIPYTELRALQTRGDDYRAYQRETSAFIPWFPRKQTS